MLEERKAHSRLFVEGILKSWWVILFFLFSYFAFDQGMKKKEWEELQLQNKLLFLMKERERAEKEQEMHRLEIASQNDPAWIEMTLIRCLGLVPEGEIKVHFTDPKKSQY